MSSNITGVFKAITTACNDTAALSRPLLEELGRRFFRSLESQGLTNERNALVDLLHDRDPKNADQTLVEAASRIFTDLTPQAKQTLIYSTDLRPLHERMPSLSLQPSADKPVRTAVVSHEALC